MTDYAIIVAGGKGLRMGSDVPKQFLPIAGRPVLMRTMERFREYAADLHLILVLPEAQQSYWRELCQQHGFPLPPKGVGQGLYQLASGGATRFHSVQSGLALIPDDATGVVAVHDGVRPFPSIDVIRRCFDTARQTGAAVPVVPVVETLRRITTSQPYSQTVPRSDYRLVQTPQVFSIQLLKAANRQSFSEAFTDDASVVEAYGHTITLVEGNRENIKVTTPYDLRVAETLI